jgi:NAD(P)-dependent dehydrogenase (short-subunit alcohol dehydrogenase family)
MDLQLTNRTAFIAASSKGLGYACAEQLLREGANVAICSRSHDNIRDAAERLKTSTNTADDRILPLQCDVRNKDDIQKAVNETAETFGGIDVQINNHGGPPAISFNQATDKQWDEAYNGVIKSNRWLAEASLPYLQESSLGTLAAVTSASAREPSENHALSNVFRLGLYGMIKTIALEYGSEVRANLVTPRFVMTDRVQYKTRRRAENRDISMEEALESRNEESLLNRPGEPSEFADAVVYLVSPRASYITGEILSVDGGWSRYVL